VGLISTPGTGTLFPLTLFFNPAVRRDSAYGGLFSDDEYRDVRRYYTDHRDAPPTPLKHLHSLARDLGLSDVYAKDETARFGITAFKIVGVRYAVHRLGGAAMARGLVCATAGNHGRAVARVARDERVPCTVFVPKPSRRVSPAATGQESRGKDERPAERIRNARVQAMRADGADVIDVNGTYEQAVRDAAAFGERTGATIVSDTSWAGYEQVPRWIMAGYTHILEEASSQWRIPPTLVVVQAGVGGLVCAAASWFARRFGSERPYFVAAEPEEADCLLQSAQAHRPTTIDSSLDTIMAGLRCAEPSPVAWPGIASGVDAFVTVPDSAAIEAMRSISRAPDDERIDAGPSGACGIAALAAIATSADLRDLRSAAGLDRSARALAIITEGP
jgi:diaminopropionate ammonia-lyase